MLSTNNCLFCGKAYQLKPKGYRSKYCSASCRGKASYYRNNLKDWQTTHHQIKLEQSGALLVKCEICGKKFRQVGSHIYLKHGITAREYRELYGFDVKKGQLPEDYRQQKRADFYRAGIYENLEKGQKYWFKKGQEGLGKYKRSRQTMERLKNNPFKKKKNDLEIIPGTN